MTYSKGSYSCIRKTNPQGRGTSKWFKLFSSKWQSMFKTALLLCNNRPPSTSLIVIPESMDDPSWMRALNRLHNFSTIISIQVWKIAVSTVSSECATTTIKSRPSLKHRSRSAYVLNAPIDYKEPAKCGSRDLTTGVARSKLLEKEKTDLFVPKYQLSSLA